MVFRKVAASLVIAAFVLVSTVPLASAKPPARQKVQQKFYKFSPTDFHAMDRGGDITWVAERERPNFERLMKLKRSFMSRIYKTDRLKAFK